MLTLAQKKQLQKANYKLVGEHAAVKLCHWTKESIKSGGERVCYKEKFYGITCHRCLQMTPILPACNLRCTHCWRDHRYFSPRIDYNLLSADQIVSGTLKAQRELLTGLGGTKHSVQHLRQAMKPTNAAISLDGEPTLYPKLPELIEGYHKIGMTTFLVTNGMHPDMLTKVNPYQLYISITSPNKEFFNRTQHPIAPACWENLLESLDILSSLKCRTVIRLTLAKNFNMIHIEKYAKLIMRAQPMFIEVKAFMPIGAARQRLSYTTMPSHEEILLFTQKLSELIGYRLKDHSPPSRVALLARF